MATTQDKNEYDKKTGRLVQPAKAFPRIPNAVKENPKYKQAWEEYEKQIDEWVRTGRGG
jgi:hypothetical protein